MEVTKPPESASLSEIDGTVIIPTSDGDYPEDLFRRIVSRNSDQGGGVEIKHPLFDPKDGYYELDFESLAQVLWEHRQYSAAREFSRSQMEILRAVQILAEDKDRVLNSDVKDVSWIDYGSQTISQSLTALADRGLLSKERDGVFRYNGFADWKPPREDDDETGNEQQNGDAA